MRELDVPELLIYDEPEPCPYLPGRTARMPLRRPVTMLSPEQLDARLATGDRRSGWWVYRPTCPGCAGCEAVRIEVDAFQPNRSQRRALRRGDAALRVELGPCEVDDRRVRLYNLHNQGRGLARDDRPITAREYASFLVDSCCDTLEFRYLLGEELVAVAVADRGAVSLSAVYCHYDPAREKLSLGVYSILKQIEACRRWGLKWLYLGFYIAASEHMAYKGRYLPHERLIGGRWQRFDRRDDRSTMKRVPR